MSVLFGGVGNSVLQNVLNVAFQPRTGFNKRESRTVCMWAYTHGCVQLLLWVFC